MKNPESDAREKLQRVLAEINECQTTVDVLRQQISSLANSLSELSMTVGAIKVIKDLKPDTEILVPIGSDSFIKAKLSLVGRVLTGLGAEVVAERSADDAIRDLESRAAEVEKAMGLTRDELNKLEDRIEALRPEAERMLQRVREAPKK